MNKINRAKLTKSYNQYRKMRFGKRVVLRFLRSFMPEMIFRTTKLEGESVTRKAISTLFKG
ncbi:MAG: hypothetical protein COX79_03935 [Candidatus Levybacteria bacterium CG_4_10_14_0_2_um_filter_36_16]|nr:MAG: hypothetical protein COU26_04315 [Candidatus Levybacteria bacterium CG10_big_fil_rev_8_21_14_0_10_36_30]PIZ96995.1 MAG: hypothetical protein COX79_03935 [Candidatus Levybacteria bacterium CG_4_10_14_0_2_um_filter_36_16]